jgi:quercetin dioxygenase-like cupin family protein
MQKLSLDALGRELLSRAAAGPGRAGQTVIGGHEKSLRQTIIAMTANAELTEHASPGQASVQVLRGRVVLSSNGHSWDGRDGDLIIVPDTPHSLRAEQDSVILLTVAKVPLLPLVWPALRSAVELGVRPAAAADHGAGRG